jgi:hypothetical protein
MLVTHYCRPATNLTETAETGIKHLLEIRTEKPEIWTHEVIERDKKIQFIHLETQSIVRQELLRLAYARGPASYLEPDRDTNEFSWTHLDKNVLCFETSKERPRPYPDKRVLEWKIEGGNEFLPQDELFVEKIRKREEKWRKECTQAIIVCEREIEDGGLLQPNSLSQLIHTLSTYMSLFLDSFIEGDKSGEENYFYRTVEAALSSKTKVWSLVDNPYTPKCFIRIHRELLKHTECYLDGKFTDQCVESFVRNAGYLELRDVHKPELYDKKRAKEALEKFSNTMNASTWSREIQRLREEDILIKANYESILREISENPIARRLAEFAALTVIYDETLRDLRTRSLVILRETMLTLDRDLASTSLDEIIHDLKKASKIIHP